MQTIALLNSSTDDTRIWRSFNVAPLPRSAALDLAYVACGRFDGFWEDGLSPWDIAAGMLLIEEARGKVTNFDNQPLSIYTLKVLASNGLVHDDMLRVLKHGF